MTDQRSRNFLSGAARHKRAIAAAVAIIAVVLGALAYFARPQQQTQVSRFFDYSDTAGTPPIFTSGEAADIPSTYNVDDWTLPTSIGGPGGGEFRAFCEFSHMGYNDPLLFPGQPGASHLHMFYGNPSTDANSTYASLRAAANSRPGSQFSCSGGPNNASAYWHPALLKDNVECDASHPGTETCAVIPDYTLIYYKRSSTIGKTVRMPRGLAFIYGRDLATGALSPTRQVSYKCGANSNSAKFLRNSDGTAAFDCPSTARLQVWMTGPTCWNGTSLGSGNYRSHMAFYGTGDASGTSNCPSTHPYSLPAYELVLNFSHNGPDDYKEWYASSDRMPGYPLYRNGESMHTDVLFAWDYSIMSRFMINCNGLNGSPRDCSDGNLGDGTKLKQMVSDGGPISFTATPEADRYMALPTDEMPAEVDPVAGHKRGTKIRRMHHH